LAFSLGAYAWSQTGKYSEDEQLKIERYLEIYNKLKPYGCCLVYYYQATHQWRSKEQTFSIMKLLIKASNVWIG